MSRPTHTVGEVRQYFELVIEQEGLPTSRQAWHEAEADAVGYSEMPGTKPRRDMTQDDLDTIEVARTAAHALIDAICDSARTGSITIPPPPPNPPVNPWWDRIWEAIRDAAKAFVQAAITMP